MGLKHNKTFTKGWGADAVTIEAGTVEYAGAVLKTGSETIRIMSDVWATGYYALVWTGTGVAKVSTGNSEFGSDTTVTVDATPEVVAAANDWLLAKKVAELKAAHAASVSRTAALATVVAKGKEVTVVKGRKVPKGTTGTVIWIGDGHYGTRVGVKDAAGTVHWTAKSNVEVTNPDDYLDIDALMVEPSIEALTAEATANLSAAASYYHGYGGHDFDRWFTVAASVAAAA